MMIDIKMQIAGENFVSGSGVFRYWSMAILNESVLSSPARDVFNVMRRFTVDAMVDPQLSRNFWVWPEMNSGPPSLDNSSGIPNVMNVRFSKSTNPSEPLEERSTMGQLE